MINNKLNIQLINLFPLLLRLCNNYIPVYAKSYQITQKYNNKKKENSQVI